MRWLLDRFATAPAAVAFVHQGRQVSYGEVIERVSAFSKLLASNHIERGATVSVIADYSPEVFCFILALAENGNIIIPLTRESVVERSTALDISGCDWLAEFDAEGAAVSIRPHRVTVVNELLEGLRRTDHAGLILFSSGSTGRPKAILHDLELVSEKFRRQRSATVAIAFLMLDHFGGINTILAITSSLGTVVTVADRTVSSICRAIEDNRVELLPATPSFLTMLTVSGAHREHDLTSLRRITYGTEVMPQPTLDRLRQAFPGVELQQTYGLSEVGVLRSQSRPDGSLWVRVGGEGFETKVVDGILWIRSRYAMLGYLNAPSAFDDEGWFNTQDRVEVDGEYFRILGRTTDIINVGGQKVYPAEVEDVILGMDNVLDASVAGEPHPLLGQIVVARVALREPEPDAALKKRVRAWCQKNLASHKIPAKVFATESVAYSVRQKKVR